MVRKCIVANCSSTDETILSHRFPRKTRAAEQWQDALDLKHISLDLLFSKYVVCTKHFSKTDYRNAISRHLNSTARPSLNSIDYTQQIYHDDQQTLESNKDISKLTFIHIEKCSDEDDDYNIQIDLNENQQFEYSDPSEEEYCSNIEHDTFQNYDVISQNKQHNNERYITEEDGIDNITDESNISLDTIEYANNDCKIDYEQLSTRHEHEDDDKAVSTSMSDECELDDVKTISRQFGDISKECLIQELSSAYQKIHDLEAKLKKIQEEHAKLVNTVKNFGKIIS